jgi:uncharacterized membrane protein HdeD (DUF308 family)
VSIPRWARRGSRLDRWYARSYRNRVLLVSGVTAVILGAVAGSESDALDGALIALLAIAVVCAWAFAGIFWRRAFGRFVSRGGRAS